MYMNICRFIGLRALPLSLVSLLFAPSPSTVSEEVPTVSIDPVLVDSGLQLRRVDSRQVRIEWGGGQVLEEADQLSGPFSVSENQSNPQIVSVENSGTKFYRLARNSSAELIRAPRFLVEILDHGAGVRRTQTVAWAINDNGVVVGGVLHGNSRDRPFIWDSKSREFVFPVDERGWFLDINNHGVAVGQYGPDFGQRGFIYDGEEFVGPFAPDDLIDIDRDYQEVNFRKINESGQIVAQVRTDRGPSTGALIDDFGFRLLEPCFNFDESSEGADVNSHGNYAGSYFETLDRSSAGVQRAFIHSGFQSIEFPPEGVTYLPPLGLVASGEGGYDHSAVHAMNDSNVVVGTSVDGQGERKAVMWRKSEQDVEFSIEMLGSLGGIREEAYAINEIGEVVGHGQTQSGDFRAFFWKEGCFFDLNEIAEFPDGFSDVTLEYSRDINNRGEIVGLGRRNGRLISFLARPILE